MNIYLLSLRYVSITRFFELAEITLLSGILLVSGVFHGFADRSDVLAGALYRMAGSGDERGETEQ
jgi:hypothetical protein